MRKKKILAAVLIIIAVLSVCTGVGIFLFGKNPHAKNHNPTESHKEGDVTRFEWLKMLCEQFGMTEYENETPYFSDVDENNANFSYVQSAAEWEVINTASDFDGNKYATGEFIGITAMKTIGENKIQICLDQEEEISDDAYFRLAADYHLVNEEQQAKGFTKDECEDILGKLKELYFGTFSPDDISRVEYQDGVVELPPEAILQRNEDNSEITVDADTLASISQGTILVFEQANSGLKQAMRVENLDESGLLSLSPVQPEEVIESLAVSDVREITADDIIRYYGVGNHGYMAQADTYKANPVSTGYSAIPMAKIKSKGFKIGLSTDMGVKNNILTITLTDHTTGLSYEVNHVEIDEKSYYNGELDIDKIAVTSQIKFKWLSGLEYADVELDSHMAVNWGFEYEREKDKKAAEKIMLCETPIPLGNGVVGVKVRLFLVISLQGSISLEAEVPVQFAVRYEKGKGVRNFKHDVAIEEPAIECDLEADGKLRLEPALVILSEYDFIDVEADVGVMAKVNVKKRLTQMTCFDVSICFPTITLSVCGDDDNLSLIRALGISAEWEIITDENAPFRFGRHYETDPDGTSKRVDACTYVEGEAPPTEEPEVSEEPADQQEEETDRPPDFTEPEEPQTTVELNHTYTTRYAHETMTDYPVYQFDYSDNWTIVEEEIYGENGNTADDEFVTLKNGRGVEIIFVFNPRWNYEYSGREAYYVEITKVADSPFVPVGYTHDSDFSYLGNFVVAQGKVTGWDYMLDEEPMKEIDDGDVFYALMPESRVGLQDGIGIRDARANYYNCVYFDYYADTAFYAKAPDGKFTPEEEQEVIAILSSFRLVL